MRLAVLTGLLILHGTSSATAAGFAHNASFMVFSPAQPSQEQAQLDAEYVLARAEELRSEIAEQWLGEAIPAGIGRTSINVSFNPGEESALTWAKDHPDRTLHSVYLRTTPDRVQQAVEEMLPHEMVHVVLATRFPHPNRLPVWIEEGIASRYDDDERMAVRRDTVRWWAQTQNWPRLASLFGAKSLHANDASGYAAAASLVEYLLSQKDAPTLLAFARDGQEGGWDSALKTHYHIADTSRLQSQWQSWISQVDRVAVQ